MTVAVAGKGTWSLPEGAFAWSLGKKASLDLCLDSDVKEVSFDLGAYLPTDASHQHVTVRAGGGPPVEVDFDSAHRRQAITIPIMSDRSRSVHVAFDLPDAISPAQAGQSDDERQIAIGLYGVSAR